MKRYKVITVTKTKRVRIKDLHFINGNLADITFQERRRVRVKKPVTPGSLVFHDNGYTIAWEDDSVRLSPATFLLVFWLWRSLKAGRHLSKEEMREHVVGDEDANDSTLRGRIKQARKELEAAGFPFKIVTLLRKGYQLVPAIATGNTGDEETQNVLNVLDRATKPTALTRRAEAVKLGYG